MEISIPRGKSKITGKILDISEVNENGLKCNCACVTCGRDLVAVFPQERVKHFRHYTSTECSGGIETSLHQLAKEIFLDHNLFFLPGNGEFSYSKVKIEKEYVAIQPDVQLIGESEALLFVEIKVANKVSRLKLEKIRGYNVTCVEIDLSKVDRNISRKDLEQLLIFQTDLKLIVFKGKETVISKDSFSNSSSSNTPLLGFLLIPIFL